MGYSEDLSRIFDQGSVGEKNQAISIIFALLGKLASEIKEEQDRLGKPKALKKQVEKAKKILDNDEETQRLTAQYQEAKTSKVALSEKRQLLKNIKKHQKQLLITIKRG